MNLRFVNSPCSKRIRFKAIIIMEIAFSNCYCSDFMMYEDIEWKVSIPKFSTFILQGHYIYMLSNSINYQPESSCVRVCCRPFQLSNFTPFPVINTIVGYYVADFKYFPSIIVMLLDILAFLCLRCQENRNSWIWPRRNGIRHLEISDNLFSPISNISWAVRKLTRFLNYKI